MSFMEFTDFSSSCGPVIKDSNISENLLADLSLSKALTGYSRNSDLVFKVLK